MSETVNYSELALLILLGLLALALLPSPPVAQATPTLQSYIEDVHTFSSLAAVDVASNGTLLAVANGGIQRSVDSGTTWTQTLSGGGVFGGLVQYANSGCAFTFVSVGTYPYAYADLYRSVDDGQTWELVGNDVRQLWRLDEMANGTLLLSTYNTAPPPSGLDYIYKSDDDGETWTIWQNLTDYLSAKVTAAHVHCVRVNPYNDDIWVLGGDDTSVLGVWRWNSGATSWATIYNVTGGRYCYDDIIFDVDHVYITPDHDANEIYRLPARATSWNEKEEVFDLSTDETTMPAGDTSSRTGFSQINDELMLIATEKGTIIASWNGVSWIKTFQVSVIDRYAGLTCFSRHRDLNGYIWFVRTETAKLYRCSLTAVEVKNTFGGIYDEYFGTQDTTAGCLRLPVRNGCDYVFASQPQNLSKARLSVTGLSSGNFATNGDFEYSNTTGWAITNETGLTYRVSTTAYAGTYSLNVNATPLGEEVKYAYILCPTSLSEREYAESYTLSFYLRTNRTVASCFHIEFGYIDPDGTWITKASTVQSGSTSWTKKSYSSQFATTLHPRRLMARIKIKQLADYGFAAYIDSIMFSRLVKSYRVYSVNDGNTYVHRIPADRSTESFRNSLTNTSNVTLSFSNGQSITVDGELSEEQHEDFLLQHTHGPLTFTAMIDGSCQTLITYQYDLCPGDANGDARVDILDLYALGRTYGSDASKPSWNLCCDFNNDGAVDEADLRELSENYGRSR